MTTQLATLARPNVGGAPVKTFPSLLAAVLAAIVVTTVVAVVGLIVPPDDDAGRALGTGPSPSEASHHLTGTLRSSDVSAGAVSYDVGQSSGWHVHPGIHAIVVTAGTLTVYDAACVRRTFGPGDTHVGGQELHLARNETSAPVEMIVTIIEPAAAADSVVRRPPPAACGVAATPTGVESSSPL